ncbi:MAG TPA: protein kinase [Kofleriaceae bacterium]|nr:protein kinase [Kofleriaceae bacterium]
MTAGVGTASGTWASSSSGARLAPGFQLGDYRLGSPLWPLRIADAYRADGPKGPATVYVIHAKIAADPAVRDHIITGTRAAAQLPEHKHLVKTLAAGLTGDILWIATEEVDGSLVRDLLLKKRQAGTAGLGTRATGNLIAGVAAALADAPHGALAAESVAVSRTGRVRVIDIALGPGTLAATIAGHIPPQSSIAPELLQTAAPNGPGDVYAIGALLYESLVGTPLERGGPRPSDVVSGVNTQIDEIVARACHRDAAKRFGRADVLGEVVTEALNQGGAIQTTAIPKIDEAPSLDQQVSLAASMADEPSPDAAGSVVDRALAVALADTNEKWLISKGKLDYGPFSLADVIKQIEKGDIVAGNVIMDKDTGARVDVGEHPLLGPMVDAARQKRDDARRAQAEVAVQSRDKKRGAFLYTLIVLGVAGVGLAVWFIIGAVSKDKQEKVGGVAAVEGASLKVNISEPKKPPPPPKRAGGKRTGGGPGFNQGNENLSLDMSDEGDEGSETLDMGRVYQTYSKYGPQLGGCLASTGEHSANIYINIDGPSGRVSFVKINGKTNGPLFNCLGRVLRGMKFPSINGPRTRAEFDIAM